jgi:hypothetical protein
MRVVHLLRKPLASTTVASNTLKHGCGCLHIDASRVALIDEDSPSTQRREAAAKTGRAGRQTGGGQTEHRFHAARDPDQALAHYVQPRAGEALGRWPPNLILEHCPGCACPIADLDEQSGITEGTGGSTSGSNAFGQDSGWNPHDNQPTAITRPHDRGGASRFYKQIGGHR